MNRYCGVKECTIVLMILSGITTACAIGQDVSEEAQRHRNRGIAAVEIAKDPADYKEAITEFGEAVRLAPDWADAWFNMGLVQDKGGEYAGALTSLKRFLELAPQDRRAPQVKQLVDKIEYKLERKSRADNRLNALLGTWDRYDPETKEKLNAYEFRTKGEEIEVFVGGAFGKISVPVTYDGKNVTFKYLYKTFNCDTEYEIKASLAAPGILRGSLFSEVVTSKPGYPVRPGHRGLVQTELRKR